MSDQLSFRENEWRLNKHIPKEWMGREDGEDDRVIVGVSKTLQKG